MSLDAIQVLGQQLVSAVLTKEITRGQAQAASDIINRIVLPAAAAQVQDRKPGRSMVRITAHQNRLLQIDVGDVDEAPGEAQQVIDQDGRLLA